MKELLISLQACGDAREWAEGKTWQEIYDTCYRGDWLLWLFYHTNGDRKLLTLAKGHCANTVRHLMKDERSKKAVDAAIAYGNGEITKEELAYAAAAAYAASYAAADAAAAASADAAADADAYAAAARTNNRQQTADICRQYLPIEVWNITSDGTLITK